MDGCAPSELKDFSLNFPEIKFDFAHCCPADELFEVMLECANVYTDTAMLCDYSIFESCPKVIKKRIMYGSDFPAYHIVDGEGFTNEYRKRLIGASKAGINMDIAFNDF
jgi:predicted TIM-barrel fold metal-dependent hydrolase